MLTTILLSGLIIFISFTLEAITGFGCTVIALPFITILLGIKESIIILTIMALLLAAWITIKNYKFINIKQYIIIVLLMLLGMPLGIYLSKTINISILRTILAIFIIAISLLQLIFHSALKAKKENAQKLYWYHYLVLLLAGVIHGLFSSGGPLAILYTTRALPDKKQFRATLCLLWTTLNTVIVILFLKQRIITKAISTMILYLIPFMILGIIAGDFIHNKVNAKNFTLLIFISLLITGMFMLL